MNPQVSRVGSGNMENLCVKLDECNSLSEVFELVKHSVKKLLNRQRAGLMLGLADLGMKQGYFIGAFHPRGSNILVMNRAPYETAMRSLALGKDHPATIMAERGVAFYFPKVTYFSQELPPPKNFSIELVKDFDKSSVGYIL